MVTTDHQANLLQAKLRQTCKNKKSIRFFFHQWNEGFDLACAHKVSTVHLYITLIYHIVSLVLFVLCVLFVHFQPSPFHVACWSQSRHTIDICLLVLALYTTWCQEMVNECLQCQQNKIQRRIKTKIKQPASPHTDRFQTVHIGIVGPLPHYKIFASLFSSDLRYIVTMIDRATRWFECVPGSDISPEFVAHAFLSG